MKKIYFCNYGENDEEDKEKWEVGYDGEVGPFFDAIVDEKDYENDGENPLSMLGEVHVGVEDKSGRFVPL